MSVLILNEREYNLLHMLFVFTLALIWRRLKAL